MAALGSLAVAAGIGIAALNHGAGYFEWHSIYLWVTAPYGLFALVLLLPWGIGRYRVMSGCATALGLLTFTYLVYVDAMWRSTSSTSPLVVIFAPMYLALGGGIFWVLAYFILAKLIDVDKE